MRMFKDVKKTNKFSANESRVIKNEYKFINLLIQIYHMPV